MTTPGSDKEKWLFLAALSLLGATFTWQLVGDRQQVDSDLPAHETTIERQVYWPAEDGLFKKDELNYFREIAFGSEHQQLSETIRKWVSDINIRIEGNPTGEDLQAVKNTIDLLNKLQNQVHLSVGYFESSVIIHFLPEKRFQKLSAKYVSGNPGFFQVGWIEDEIYRGAILIDSAGTSQQERNALITEELTQTLGLMNVSNTYADSIFNDNEIIPGLGLSPLDATLVTMLYRPELQAGMSVEEAMAVLSNLRSEPLSEPLDATPEGRDTID